MDLTIPETWQAAIGAEFEKPYFKTLREFVDAERGEHTVYPPDADVLNALRLTPYENAHVFLLGQDPYHDEGQAHGLAFSVRPGIKTPPSLANMYREMTTDVPGFETPKHGYLVSWATQGVLLLNAYLTVRAHTPKSHRKKGWEGFTDAVIRAVNDKPEHVVFVLWGSDAKAKLPLIDATRHTIITSAHPSPLSAHTGFFGSKPFSKVNEALKAHGQTPIDWRLPATVTE